MILEKPTLSDRDQLAELETLMVAVKHNVTITSVETISSIQNGDLHELWMRPKPRSKMVGVWPLKFLRKTLEDYWRGLCYS